jgi:tRNA (Thr-GGU) A37 N-methylase
MWFLRGSAYFILHIEDVDNLDNRPLLAIKPYISEFDALDQAEVGWYSKAKYNVRKGKSDLRFKELPFGKG